MTVVVVIMVDNYGNVMVIMMDMINDDLRRLQL